MSAKKKGDEFKGVVDVDLGLGETQVPAEPKKPATVKAGKSKPAEPKKPAPRNLREQKRPCRPRSWIGAGRPRTPCPNLCSRGSRPIRSERSSRARKGSTSPRSWPGPWPSIWPRGAETNRPIPWA